MKAIILLQKGFFHEATEVIIQLAELAPEDEKVIELIEAIGLEETEKVYFTDPLPGGGVHFVTYHHDLTDFSLMGMFGSFFFLFMIYLIMFYLQQS